MSALIALKGGSSQRGETVPMYECIGSERKSAVQVIALVCMAWLALSAGVLLYLVDRPAGVAWLIPALPALQGMGLFGSVGAWLPSFVHPFGFGLLTAVALPVGAIWRYGACLGWFVVNATFEFGQLPQWAPRLADAIHALFGPSPVGERLAWYFLRGSFGLDDLAAAAGGALCAALLLRLTGAIGDDRHAR
jgi:hypothetical protein